MLLVEVFFNNRLVDRLNWERALHEAQVDFRKNRSCIDKVCTREKGKPTYAYILDVQKAYDTVWWNVHVKKW